MFLFNSHEGGLTGRNSTPSGDGAIPTATKIGLFVETLTGEERPRFMAGLLLVLVVLLHIGLGLWLIMPDESAKTPVQMFMEVSLVSVPGQKAEITPPVPPKPALPKLEPPKKEAVIKPVKKIMPVIPKPVVLPTQVDLPKPQPQPSADEQPSFSTPTVAAAVPQVVSQPVVAVVSSEPKISTGVIPLERIPPKYPSRAANRHVEGWVKIEFTITTSGHVENAVVLEAEPAEMFDEAALTAINQWKFKEKTVNGVAVEQRAVQTLQFKLTK